MADDSDADLKYRISGEADVGPIDDAEKSLGGFKETAGEAASELRHLTGSSREGQEIFRGLGAAARGGAAGVGEMVRGLRSLALVATHVIGEGPLGVLLILIGLIGGALVAMKGHAKEASDGLSGTGSSAEKANKKFEDMKARMDLVFKGLDEDLKRANEQFDALNKKIEAASKAAAGLEKANKEVADSQVALSEAQELEGAQTEEKREYIRKKYAADKGVVDAREALNTTGQAERDARVREDATAAEARRTADIAGEGQSEVDRRKQAYDDARKKAKGEVAQTYADEQKATSGGLLDDTTNIGAEYISDKSAGPKAVRAAALKPVAEQKKLLDDAQQHQQTLDDAAQKAKDAHDAATLAVENEQLVTQKETLAAINKLAVSLIDRKNVDDATVSGGMTGGEAQKDADSEAAAAAKQEKVAGQAANASAKQQAKSAEQAAKDAERVQNEMDKFAARHHDAMTTINGHLVSASSVTTRTAKKVERTTRQLENAQSYGTPGSP